MKSSSARRQHPTRGGSSTLWWFDATIRRPVPGHPVRADHPEAEPDAGDGNAHPLHDRVEHARSTSLAISSTTSSTVMSLESMYVASTLCASGATERVRSASSRAPMAARMASRSTAPPPARCSAKRRRARASGRCVQVELALRLREDHRPRVPALDHDRAPRRMVALEPVGERPDFRALGTTWRRARSPPANRASRSRPGRRRARAARPGPARTPRGGSGARSRRARPGTRARRPPDRSRRC